MIPGDDCSFSLIQLKVVKIFSSLSSFPAAAADVTAIYSLVSTSRVNAPDNDTRITLNGFIIEPSIEVLSYQLMSNADVNHLTD